MQSNHTPRWLTKLSPPKHVECLGVRLVLVMIASMLMFQSFVWMQDHQGFHGSRGSTMGMVNGTDERPYVYRILVPKTASIIESILPRELVADTSRTVFEAYAKLVKLKPQKTAGVLNRADRVLALRSIIIVLSIGLLIGYGVALFKLTGHLMPDIRGAPYIAIILGYYMLVVGSLPFSHICDPATLCFSAWCFYCIITSRVKTYLALFTFACLNKETALYFSLAFFLCAKKDKMFWQVLMAQIAIWVLITGGIRLYYADNRGILAGFYQIYSKQMGHSVGFNRFIGYLAAAWMLFYQWPQKPEMLRRVVPVVALGVVAWLLFGVPGELRAMYEIYPYVALMLTHSLFSATQLHHARLFRHV